MNKNTWCFEKKDRLMSIFFLFVQELSKEDIYNEPQ